MARRIVDMHQHLLQASPPDELAEEYARLGVVRAVLLGLPPRREPGNNEEVLAAWKKLPDLFIPFVGFDLDQMQPDDLSRFCEQGFVGVKFIGPLKPYNDPSYFPIYERASELGMVALFHTGIVTSNPPWNDCDSNLMRPIYLDHIARNFPELRIIGAHLGNPWYEEAAMSCRWNPNLFFDLAGSTLRKKTPEFLGSLLWWGPHSGYAGDDTVAWQKIVFGSDTACEGIEGVIHDYEKVMDTLNLSADLRDAVWYGTAAKLLGL